MNVSDKQDRQCHQILPIDPDEKVLAVYKHHIFAYIVPVLGAVLVITILMGLAALMTSQTSLGGNPIISVEYQNITFGAALLLSIATAIFMFIPIWLRSQEHIVLTNEAILQVLQPALFASKVSQTGLDHIADVSVRQDFLGTILGYGKLTVETPGEQDNYEYVYLSSPREAAREIIEAQEIFVAALQSGNLQPKPGSASLTGAVSQRISVNAEEYQAFQKFQQFEQQQKQTSDNQAPVQPGNDTPA